MIIWKTRKYSNNVRDWLYKSRISVILSWNTETYVKSFTITQKVYESHVKSDANENWIEVCAEYKQYML